MYSVVPLCLVRAAILAVWDPPQYDQLAPPKPSRWKATVALYFRFLRKVETMEGVELCNQ